MDVLQEKMAQLMEADQEVKAWERKMEEVGSAVDRVVERWGCREFLEKAGLDLDAVKQEVTAALWKRVEAARTRRGRILEQIQAQLIRETMKELLGSGLVVKEVADTVDDEPVDEHRVF